MTKQIDYQAISSNFKKLEEVGQKRVIAVLKNNAYNTDLVKAATAVMASGCQLVVVTTVDEAIVIKKALPSLRVLIASVLDEADFQLIADYQFELMVESTSYINRYADYLTNHNWHLKMNIGMNRFGFDDLTELAAVIATYQQQITGLYAHVSLEEEDQALYNQQIELFLTGYQLFKHKPEFVHVENSATLQKLDRRLSICTHSRIGILLYGYGHPKLTPCLTLYCKVVKIRDYIADDTFSYGLNNKVTTGMRIATIDIGYGDGIIDSRNQFPFYINNYKYQQIGKQSMSHTYLIVDEAVSIGDQVEVYGANISLSQHAKAIDYPCSKLMAYLN
ncbi:alanine racemase [Mollicutes bacterium LVI A0039]|nr:alanine racemase [Mollicutes bacterium LVI A0039]